MTGPIRPANSVYSILLVDDDPDLRETVSYLLTDAGYRVFGVANGDGMRRRLKEGDIDLIILDLNLEDENGLELAIEVRRTSKIPIIILTARRAETDRVVGLELGADDYVTKPYSSAELLARVRSVLRRACGPLRPSQGSEPKRNVAWFDGWELDLTARRLTSHDGQDAALTSGEMELLTVFVKHPDEVLSRPRLMELLGSKHNYDRSVDVQVLRLRKKIEDDPQAPRFIKMIRSAGYVFASRVEWR